MYKKLIFLLISITIMVSFTGCDILGYLVVPKTSYIAFSVGAPIESEKIVFNTEELKNIKNYGSNYRASMFYEKLNDSQKIVYTAFEYAMENGYTNIFVDNKLVENSDNLEKILIYLSLDSPLLEQNLKYDIGEFEDLSAIKDGDFSGHYITISNFSESLWFYKLLALREAKKLVKDIPKNLSDAEKAEIIYRMVSIIEYFDYQELSREEYDAWGSEAVYPYLYNALVTGKTLCDGYSNAFSLLCNMVGIPCVEKICDINSDNDTGHTWNYFKVNEKWYNADAMHGDMIPNTDLGIGPGFQFGFSDELQQNIPLFKDKYPISQEGLFLKIDEKIESFNNNTFYKKALTAYKKHNNNYALIVVEELDERALQKQINMLASSIGKSVQFHTFDIIGGKTAVFIYRWGLFG